MTSIIWLEKCYHNPTFQNAEQVQFHVCEKLSLTFKEEHKLQVQIAQEVFVFKAGERRNLEYYITTNLFIYADELIVVRMMSSRT
jgi:hypothetical protein